jgi:chromosome segregation ATPase
MSAEAIIAITGLIAAIGSILLAVVNNFSSARKSEVDSLRETIEALQAENKRLQDDNREIRLQIRELEIREHEKDRRISELEAEDLNKARRITDLESTVEVLTAQIVRLGHEPDTRPKSR